jgi:hypothetical protein
VSGEENGTARVVELRWANQGDELIGKIARKKAVAVAV